jgi:hypothetical protein
LVLRVDAIIGGILGNNVGKGGNGAIGAVLVVGWWSCGVRVVVIKWTNKPDKLMKFFQVQK